MNDLLALPDGFHAGIPDAVYHRRAPGVVSKSALDLVGRSPAHYKAWLDGEAEDETTPALEFGRAFHCALLEPDRFETAYLSEPEWGDCRKTDETTKEDAKDNKTRRDEWRAAHVGANLVSADWLRTIRGMASSARRHPLASKMILGGKSELALKWTDPETGLTCKSRLDHYVEEHAMIVDAKSTLDARWEKFRRDIVSYRYHVQDALYRSAAVELGLPVQHFVFVAIEKSPPYAVATYTLDADGIGKGHSAARADINTLAHCVKTNTWPGYPVGIREIELPPWA